ncbi:hypothetical protein [Sporomusa sp.]|uniref:hypothetical protein n=1 Tax=Sporomusa sp. TaxID=2078658 RepID=UPI002C254D01|nr:hypothetical protein [Sporomusa sp.]HWR43253.1 hypothetical protein [Sporomusa sp.]
METSSIKIMLDIPVDLYDNLVIRSGDIGVSKDTILLNALRQYLGTGAENYYQGDKYPLPASDYMASSKDGWVLPD